MAGAAAVSGVDILAVRKRLGRDAWHPPQPYGPAGYSMVSRNLRWQLIVMLIEADGLDYIRASLAGFDEPPTQSELQVLHMAVFGDGHAYQVFPPPQHAHPYSLHLFGRADGEPAMPEFEVEAMSGVR